MKIMSYLEKPFEGYLPISEFGPLLILFALSVFFLMEKVTPQLYTLEYWLKRLRKIKGKQNHDK